MNNAFRVVVVSTICLVGSLFLVRANPEKRDIVPETEELAKAVALTTAKLQTTVQSPAEYKLIKVELTWIEGKYAWRATYKPAALLPEKPAREAIGVGGEVFITVDLKSGQTKVQYGE